MAHAHSVYNTDEYFVIDPITRAITQQSGKTKLMQYDHNSERYEFRMDRYVDGHDMSLCNDVKVNYLNVSSDRSSQSKGPYVVEDMQIAPDNDKMIALSWLISRNSTQYAGTLNFNISFRCLSGAVVDYAWHTDIFKGIAVSNGIDNTDEESVEDYIDILEQWKQDVLEELNDGRVLTVNGISPDENGDVTIEIPKDGVLTVNGSSPDEFGNVTVEIPKDGVLTVNGISPDENGDVTVEIPDCAVPRIESLDQENIVSFRELESGSYILHGYFKPYPGADSTMVFSSDLVVNILKGSEISYVQLMYPRENCIQYLKVTDGSYEQNNVYLNDVTTKSYVDELIGGVENDTVKSVNGVLPDQNGDVEISCLPEGGVPGDMLVRTEDSAEWVTPATDDDIVDTLLAANLLPAVMMNGAVLRDGTGKIVLI